MDKAISVAWLKEGKVIVGLFKERPVEINGGRCAQQASVRWWGYQGVVALCDWLAREGRDWETVDKALSKGAGWN